MSDHYDDSSDQMVLSESYMLGIPSVDEQHKRLIFLCNKFRSDLMGCKTGEIKEWYTSLQDSLKEATDYVITHFATEEKLMQASQYDEYVCFSSSAPPSFSPFFSALSARFNASASLAHAHSFTVKRKATSAAIIIAQTTPI